MFSMHVLYVYDEIVEYSFQLTVEENIFGLFTLNKNKFYPISDMNVENKTNKNLKI